MSPDTRNVLRTLGLLALVAVCALVASVDALAASKPPAPCKIKGSKTYPGDDAPKAEIAKWMAENAFKAGLPAELPVMGALVESGLSNLPRGDTDSAGFFQMRVGIWDSSYPGFADDPDIQIQWFIDQALLVEASRVADGIALDDLLSNELHFGGWIADVELPAAEFRGRYQLRLEEARALICTDN
jgi:hypothetical protein